MNHIKANVLASIAPDIGSTITLDRASENYYVLGYLRKIEREASHETILEGILDKGVNDLFGYQLYWCSRNEATFLCLRSLSAQETNRIVTPIYACKIDPSIRNQHLNVFQLKTDNALRALNNEPFSVRTS